MDYLSKEEIKRKTCLMCDGWCEICGDERCIKCDSERRCDLIIELDDVPTVDAVPVVRCKDCKHNRNSEDALDWDVTPLCECKYSKMVNRGYEFCSWGERK